MKKYLEKLIDEWNKLRSDIERYNFLLEHKRVFKLNLDNDDTFATISDETFKSIGVDIYSGEADEWNDKLKGDFHDYIGWSDGIFVLLNVIGIIAESV